VHPVGSYYTDLRAFVGTVIICTSHCPGPRVRNTAVFVNKLHTWPSLWYN